MSQPGQLQWPWLNKFREGTLPKLLLCPPPLPLLFKLYEDGSFEDDVGEPSTCIPLLCGGDTGEDFGSRPSLPIGEAWSIWFDRAERPIFIEIDVNR